MIFIAYDGDKLLGFGETPQAAAEDGGRVAEREMWQLTTIQVRELSSEEYAHSGLGCDPAAPTHFFEVMVMRDSRWGDPVRSLLPPDEKAA